MKKINEFFKDNNGKLSTARLVLVVIEQVSSGIYLYHFKAVSMEGKNEVFEKTAKILMIK